MFIKTEVLEVEKSLITFNLRRTETGVQLFPRRIRELIPVTPLFSEWIKKVKRVSLETMVVI
jgi:hypothetical protein